MVTLPFLRKKDSRFFLLTSVLFFFTYTSVNSQTVIKEKVKINPSTKVPQKTQTEYSPLFFIFNGPRAYSFSISGPGGFVAGENPGFGAPPSVAYLPAVNGEYTVVVTCNYDGSTCVGYSATWVDPDGFNISLAGSEIWFHHILGNSVYEEKFLFYGIPPPLPPFDYSVWLRDHLIYGTQESVVGFWINYNNELPAENSISLSLESSDPDIMFYDPILEQNIGKTLTTIFDESERFLIKSNSVNGNYPKLVRVIAVSNGLQREDSLMIEQPNSVNAYFEKENLSPGDTVNIIIKKIDNRYGGESNYPDTTHFEVGIKKGCRLGNILISSGDTAKYFSSIKQPVRFIVADSISTDSDSITLRIGAPVIAESESPMATAKVDLKTKKNNVAAFLTTKTQNKKRNKKVEDVESCTVYTPIFTNTSDAAAEIKRKEEILLGETKYYGLKKNSTIDRYKIEEIPTKYGDRPEYPNDNNSEWKWVKGIDVWGTYPIYKISGKETGVYWEKKDTKGIALDFGMIRLIGRYWDKDTKYKVELADEDIRDVIEIIIKKPGKLGNEHATSTDVKGNLINIDDICAEIGGKNGIPPQIIKGHMQKESGFKNDYRYEPFQDIYYQSKPGKKKELFEDYDYFTVTSANMGTINIPSTHANVTPISYPNQPKKIDDFLVENIWKYIQGPNSDNGNEPKVIGSEVEKTGNLTETLRGIYNKNVKKKKKNPLTKAVDSLKKYVQSDSLKGGNSYAQTRIIASYGMFQQGYWDAATGKEPLAGFRVSNSSQPPEFLNEKDYSMKSYSERVGRNTKNKAGSNWSEGYEKGWGKILDNYNPYETGYGKNVLNNSKSFLPVK